MIELTNDPIDVSRLLASVSHADCGAEVLFVGTTRQWTSQDKQGAGGLIETDHLVYEAYTEMAIAKLRQLEQEAHNKWPLRLIAIVHRLGRVDPLEASVAVAVSSPHRSEAFEAAKWLIDELKHQVPIWKQEHYVQSGAEWIHPSSGSCSCNNAQGRPDDSQVRDNQKHYA